jgi:hypothetical protein
LQLDPSKRSVANLQKKEFRRARHLSAVARSTPITTERLVGSNRSQKMFDRATKELSIGVLVHRIRKRINLLFLEVFTKFEFWLNDVH